MDVVWRGAADSKLYDLAYRNQSWQHSASAISGGATVASTPALVSPTPGQIDAFWEDASGNLWQVQSQTGFFGAETWSTPQQLNVGSMALLSAPAAVSQAPGTDRGVLEGHRQHALVGIIQRRLVGADATQQRPRRR